MSDSGLYRSNRQNMIAGVMGGIAERFGWNANLLRIIFVLISIMSAAFPGILVYLILWLNVIIVWMHRHEIISSQYVLFMMNIR